MVLTVQTGRFRLKVRGETAIFAEKQHHLSKERLRVHATDGIVPHVDIALFGKACPCSSIVD